MISTAVVEVKSAGSGLQVNAGTRGFNITFDEPVEQGGTNQGMNPVEGLLSALGGCQSIATLIFAHAQGVALDEVSITVEGDIDTDGFLGINPDVRCGLQEVRLKVHVKCADKEAGEKLAKLAEQRCPVGDTVRNPVPVVTTELVVE